MDVHCPQSVDFPGQFRKPIFGPGAEDRIYGKYAHALISGDEFSGSCERHSLPVRVI
jgi:hypothetical protein